MEQLTLTHGYFYGKPLRTREIAGFVLSEAAYPPNHNLPRHSHKLSCFMSILQGSVTETYAKKELTGKPSALIFRPAGELHSDRFHNVGGRLFLIEIENWWLDRVREYTGMPNNPARLYAGIPTTLSRKLYSEFRHMDEVSALVVEGLMLEMIADVSRSDKAFGTRRPPRWIEQTEEILRAQYAERLTLAYIAGLVGIHPVHLGQTFRAHYQCSLGEYVRRLRIEFVCRELGSSDTALTDIALSAGFADQSHLTRTFKRSTGMTPSEYRLLHRSS